MIIYREERAEDLVDEIKLHIHNHWEEVEQYKDKIKLNPDFNKYIELDNLGMLHVVTARREQDLKLIGYFISVIMPPLHHKDHLFAVSDIIYIAPEYRGKLLGLKLIKYTEKKLKEKGVSVLNITMKTHASFEKILERIDFNKQEITYTKYIGV